LNNCVKKLNDCAFNCLTVSPPPQAVIKLRKLSCYTFTLPGVAVVPYVRMTQRGKFCDPAALRYLDSQRELKALFGLAMQRRDPLPGQTPLYVDILLRRPTRLHTCDLDNLVKALLDAMNKVVYPDDRWIDVLTARRELGPAEVFIEVGRLP